MLFLYKSLLQDHYDTESRLKLMDNNAFSSFLLKWLYNQAE